MDAVYIFLKRVHLLIRSYTKIPIGSAVIN